jgi:hypothetical protein
MRNKKGGLTECGQAAREQLLARCKTYHAPVPTLRTGNMTVSNGATSEVSVGKVPGVTAVWLDVEPDAPVVVVT